METFSKFDFNNSSGVETSKHVRAFIPNYIHSLEASHLAMTAVACYKKNMNFGSIHDSYWTHAADIPSMNKVCDSFN